MNIRDIPRAVLVAAAILLVVIVAAVVMVRVTPSVTVNVELTPAAREHLLRTRLPICVDLTIATGVRSERRCLFDAGDVVFGGHPYLRRPDARLALRAHGYDGGPTQHSYNCSEITRPIDGPGDLEFTVRCDLR